MAPPNAATTQLFDTIATNMANGLEQQGRANGLTVTAQNKAAIQEAIKRAGLKLVENDPQFANRSPQDQATAILNEIKTKPTEYQAAHATFDQLSNAFGPAMQGTVRSRLESGAIEGLTTQLTSNRTQLTTAITGRPATPGAPTPPPAAVTTPDVPGSGQEEGGIMGFLGKNKGGIIGAIVGVIINMVTGGGGGIMGMLLPLLLGVGGSLLVDGGKGMLGGMLGMGGNQQTPPAQGQGQGQGVGAPSQGQAQNAAINVEQPMMVNGNAQIQVKNGTQVINTIANNGSPQFAAATGTPPRGNEITIIENAPAAPGATTRTPAFQYTGRVEGDNFVITSVSAPVAGSNPPQMGAPVRSNPPISLPIGADGKVSLNQPAGSPLTTARTQATEKAANFNRSKDLTITEVATPPGQAQKVSTQLDPITRDGVTYNVTLQGTRDANGVITFNAASMTQTTGTPPVTTPVNNPNTGAPTFEVRNMAPVRQSAGTPPKVTITEGLASNVSEGLVNFTRRVQRQAEAAQAQARGQRQNALVGAINSAPNAEQALNNLESTLSAQLTQSGMNPLDANLAANVVTNFYTQQSNRGATFNADALKDQLKNTMRPAIPGNPPQRALTDKQVDAIVAEVSAQNTAINTAINAKPMNTVPAGSTTPAPTASSNIPRVARTMSAPSLGTPVAPTAMPGMGAPGTSTGVGGP